MRGLSRPECNQTRGSEGEGLALAGVTLVRLGHWRDAGSIPYYLRWIVASLVGLVRS